MLVADTATVTAEAFERMARDGDRGLLARVNRVLLAEGRKPAPACRQRRPDGDLRPRQAGCPGRKRPVAEADRSRS